MSERVLDNWLDAYKRYSGKSETPDLFHMWAGVSTLAAATARKIKLEFLYVTLYTNFWILLVAPPGICRKGDAIRISKQLCDTCKGIVMSSESLTREKLISEFAAARNYYRRKLTGEGMVSELAERISAAALTVHSSEFHVFMGQSDGRFMSDLTDLYDCHDTWQYGTIGRGDTKLNNVWLNMLGATTPISIGEFMPQSAVGGGFLSRFILVAAERKARLVSLVELQEEDKRLFAQLAEDLTTISQLRGSMTLDKRARDWYSNWYSNFSELALEESDYRLKHYLSRRPTHMLKLAAIQSLATDSTMIITEHDLVRADNLLSMTEEFMHIALGGFGRDRYASTHYNMTAYIKRNKTVTHQSLVLTFIKEMSITDITACVDSMVAAGEIARTRTNKGVGYKWTGIQGD